MSVGQFDGQAGLFHDVLNALADDLAVGVIVKHHLEAEFRKEGFPQGVKLVEESTRGSQVLPLGLSTCLWGRYPSTFHPLFKRCGILEDYVFFLFRAVPLPHRERKGFPSNTTL
jgi:hypothetical protein